MQEIYDIIAVAIVTLALMGFITTWNIDTNERYLINLEYYALETFLNSEIDGIPIYERIMEKDIDKKEMKDVLDKTVPNGYLYLFEIPEYELRITNFDEAKSIDYCVQIDKIYPINLEFNEIHIIFGIWNKDQKYKVIKCEQ